VNKRPRICSECQTRTEFRKITVEHERNGIRVQVSEVPAMVCPNCGTRSFPPGVTDRIIVAVNEMMAAAERARQLVPDFQYLVSMTTPATQVAEQQASYQAVQMRQGKGDSDASEGSHDAQPGDDHA
jgi:YgiT-type zinc finger domain-containing protein